MKFKKSFIGILLAAIISVTAIAPCSVVYADTSKTESAKSSVPTNFKSSKTTTTITLKWDEVDGADAYRVYMLNPVSGKYEKYKNVKTNSCKVTELIKDTKYYFKVSVLKKNGEKYKEVSDSKSKRVAVTTKATDTKNKTGSKSDTKKDTIKTFNMPETGDKKKDVLKNCGITNYENVEDNIYMGDVIYSGIESTLFLSFNEDDRLYLWSLRIPCSYSTGLYMIKSYKQNLGYDYTYSDGRYTWQNKREIASIEYDFDYKQIVIGYMDSKYYDK